MATIGEAVSGGTEGSVLFVGSGPVLAQDNAGLYFDEATNTLRSASAAGGAASDGTQPILEKIPTSLHERTPLIIGSKDEVERILTFLR